MKACSLQRALVSVLIIGMALFFSACTETIPEPTITVALSPETPVTASVPEVIIDPLEKIELPEEVRAILNTADICDSSENVRKFPYPYKAMLSIVSDSDTATPTAFADIHRFLNTKEQTAYGEGLGLDISDSFWMYMGSNLTGTENNMTYFKGLDYNTPLYAEQIKKYYKCGWIDSIHTYGDFSRLVGSDITFTRELAQKAQDEINRTELSGISVWIDHGNSANVQNYAAYNPLNASSYQKGDDPNSEYYHTDISLAGNIRFVWYSRHSNVFGSDYPVFEKTLRDGKKIYAFNRYTNEYNGSEIVWNWTPEMIGQHLTKEHLDGIISGNQYSLVAQHLSYYGDGYTWPKDSIDALKLLAKYANDDKTILVARSSRLLNYAVAEKNIRYSAVSHQGTDYINLICVEDPVGGTREAELYELRGITVYCDDPDNTVLLIGGRPLSASDVQRNPVDETGRKSIAVKWFEPDYTDYSIA